MKESSDNKQKNMAAEFVKNKIFAYFREEKEVEINKLNPYSIDNQSNEDCFTPDTVKIKFQNSELRSPFFKKNGNAAYDHLHSYVYVKKKDDKDDEYVILAGYKDFWTSNKNKNKKINVKICDELDSNITVLIYWCECMRLLSSQDDLSAIELKAKNQIRALRKKENELAGCRTDYVLGRIFGVSFATYTRRSRAINKLKPKGYFCYIKRFITVDQTIELCKDENCKEENDYLVKFDSKLQELETKKGKINRNDVQELCSDFILDLPSYILTIQNKLDKIFGEIKELINRDVSKQEDLSHYIKDKFINVFDINMVPAQEEKDNKKANEQAINESNRRDNGTNIIYYGIPGCGKSYTVNQYYPTSDYVKRIVFHQNYTYEEFVGQVGPIINEETEAITYDFIPGTFTAILKSAYNDPQNSYTLIIEEINRGDAPSIFGDIFQLLDRLEKDIKDGETIVFKKRTSEYAIYNENIAKEVYNDKSHGIRIPSNLSIVATMNTSDQNVFTLDTAFQRRWQMEYITNKFNESENRIRDENIVDTKIKWEKFCNCINEQIANNAKNGISSGDKRLGVYFVNKEELTKEDKFSGKVLKYLWDDAFKFNRDEVFKDDINIVDDIFDKFTTKDGFDQIFKDEILKALKSEETKK